MSEEIKEIVRQAKENEKAIKIVPYEEIKANLDKIANETAYKSAIEFSKLFRGA
ncbi:MAG: hypothetical protein LBL98_06150 [Ruminococcus sp.]|nr:hypothetical protein [Ruminococcus sp.]